MVRIVSPKPETVLTDKTLWQHTMHFVLSSKVVSLPSLVQAARVIAQLLVAGGTILFRAGAQAYKQAIVSAFPLARLAYFLLLWSALVWD